MKTVRMAMRAAALLGIASCLAAAPLRAETPEELDQLARASETPDTGLQLARQQAAAGEYLPALATLERVLFVKPKAKSARLLHAMLLCRIDDPQGAEAEFSRLKKGDYKKPEWREAKEACPAVFPPKPERR